MAQLREVFVRLCRLHNGRAEGSTCYLPLSSLSLFLSDLSREVSHGLRTGEIEPRYERLEVVGEELERGVKRSAKLVLHSFGERVRVDAELSVGAGDKLFRGFRRERSEDGMCMEARYTISLSNESLRQAWGSTETTWDRLGDDVDSLLFRMDFESAKMEDSVEREAWEWFKERVEKASNWIELILG